MRITFLLLFAILYKITFSQSIEKVKESLEKKDFPLFKRIIQETRPEAQCSLPDESTYREILNQYTEVVCYIRISVPPPNDTLSGDCYNYQVNLLAKDTLIIKYSLYKKTYDKDIHLTLLKDYSNDTEIEVFKDRYAQTFYRSLSMDELFDDSSTFGWHCGIIGRNPDDRTLMEKYVEEGNHEKLFDFLTSPCFEKKLYGYEGLMALKYNGYQLTEKEKKIISHFKDFKGPIRTCRGCLYSSEKFPANISLDSDEGLYLAMNMSKKKMGKKLSYLKLTVFGLFILFGIGLIFRKAKGPVVTRNT